MITALDYYREFNLESVALRLVLAVVLGGIIGVERGRKRRAAGFRTHILVCMGAALSGILSQYVFTMLETKWAEVAAIQGTSIDVTHIASRVIGGVGFLGAGTILFTKKNKVTGLTTAAGLWTSACVGIAIGAGFYELVTIAGVLIFLIFQVFPKIEMAMIEKSRNMHFYVEMEQMQSLGRIIDVVKASEAKIYEISVNKEGENPGVFFAVGLHGNIDHDALVSAISDIDGILMMEEL